LSIIFVFLGSAFASLLDPISTIDPKTLFGTIQHKVAPTDLFTSVGAQGQLVPTNNFWSNFISHDPNNAQLADVPVNTLPYVFKINQNAPFGMAVFPPNNPGFCAPHEYQAGQYDAKSPGCYIYGFNSIFQVAAVEFKSLPSRSVPYFDPFAAHIQFNQGSGSLTFPLVRGMSMVTAVFSDLTPLLAVYQALSMKSSQFVNGSFTGSHFQVTMVMAMDKTKPQLNYTEVWAVFTDTPVTWSMSEATDLGISLTASAAGSVTVRLARLGSDPKDPELPSRESLYLQTYTRWPVGGVLDAGVQSSSLGWWNIAWKTQGNASSQLLHFALEHHKQNIDTSLVTATALKSATTTFGNVTGYLGDKWVFREPGLTSIRFTPPTPINSAHVPVILQQAIKDISTDFTPDLVQGDNYAVGKGMNKVAQACLVADALGNETLRDDCVRRLSAGFDLFIAQGSEAFDKLKYDVTWGGVIGQNGIVQNPGVDYGEAYYNDHHYHYGYIISAAAIVRKFNETWGAANQDWVECLIRDVANPSPNDPYFPVFRVFDWFMGHAWSHGITPSADGKDEESITEGINFFYGAMLWGEVSGNQDLAGLANLQLALARRTFSKYVFLDPHDPSPVHPPAYLKHMVPGIYFEQKCDYAKWFPGHWSTIHAIHMLPMSPVVEVVRYPKTVGQEWSLKLGDKVVAEVLAEPVVNDRAWASLLLQNKAIIDAEGAFSDLQNSALVMDSGLFRCWALYFASTRPAAPPVPPTMPLDVIKLLPTEAVEPASRGGCLDPRSAKYHPSATFSDGSC